MLIQLLLTRLLGRNQDYGQGTFYQSSSALKLQGQRPTDYRIKKYELEKYLSGGDKTVLDIGCNVGFLDIDIAQWAKHIKGVEYNKRLVLIAKIASRYLHLRNVEFVCGDFNNWSQKDKDCYDIIFSFAVHRWINMPSQEYSKVLTEKLNRGGYIIFESQNVNMDKELFMEYLEAFRECGLDVIKEDTIKDDGRIERMFVVLKKTD